MDTDGYLRSESEERIANKGAGSWTTNSQPMNHDLELGAGNDNAYSASAAGGNEDKEGGNEMWGTMRNEENKQNILRTVHIRQYSSYRVGKNFSAGVKCGRNWVTRLYHRL